MNRMEALKAKRRAARHAVASAAVARILSDGAANGVDITLFGSLAKDDFRLHSDVNLLVRGRLARKQRILAERLVADALRSADIPYDLMFEEDLTVDKVTELLA